jgi:hypothetical protein
MGTRSTIKFFPEFSETPILSIYNQYDGYMSGVGRNLAEWLKNKTMVNGFLNENIDNGFANGMGCLAAQYVKEHKIKIGGLYLTTHDDTQDYDYEVRFINDAFQIKVDEEFIGTPDELLEFIAKMENI